MRSNGRGSIPGWHFSIWKRTLIWIICGRKPTKAFGIQRSISENLTISRALTKDISFTLCCEIWTSAQLCETLVRQMPQISSRDRSTRFNKAENTLTSRGVSLSLCLCLFLCLPQVYLWLEVVSFWSSNVQPVAGDAKTQPKLRQALSREVGVQGKQGRVDGIFRWRNPSMLRRKRFPAAFFGHTRKTSDEKRAHHLHTNLAASYYQVHKSKHLSRVQISLQPVRQRVCWWLPRPSGSSESHCSPCSCIIVS